MPPTSTTAAVPVGVQCPFPIPSSPCRCTNAAMRRRGGGGGAAPPTQHFGGSYGSFGSSGCGSDTLRAHHHHHYHHAAGQHSYSSFVNHGHSTSPSLDDALNATLFYQPHLPHSPPTYFCLRCVLLCICSTSTSSAGGDGDRTRVSSGTARGAGGVEGTLVEARLAAERATQLLIALHTFTQSQDHQTHQQHPSYHHQPTSDESLLLPSLCKYLFSSGWVAALFLACLDRLRGENPFHIRRVPEGGDGSDSSPLCSFERLLKRLPIASVVSGASTGGGPCLLQALSALQSEMETSSTLPPNVTTGWSPRLAALLHAGIHFASTVFLFVVGIVEGSMLMQRHHVAGEMDNFHNHPSHQEQSSLPLVLAGLVSIVEDVPAALVDALSTQLLSSCGLSDTVASLHTLTDLLQRVNELDVNEEESTAAPEKGGLSSSSLAGSKWRSLFSDSSTTAVHAVGSGSSVSANNCQLTSTASHHGHQQDERQGLIHDIKTLSQSCLLHPILFQEVSCDEDIPSPTTIDGDSALLLATSTSSTMSSTYFIPKVLIAFVNMMDVTLGGGGADGSPVQLHLLSMLRQRLLTSCAAPSYQFIQTALMTLRSSCDSALDLLSHLQHQHHPDLSHSNSLNQPPAPRVVGSDIDVHHGSGDGDTLYVIGAARNALYRLQYHTHLLLGGVVVSLAGSGISGSSCPSFSHELISLMFTTPDETSLLLPTSHATESDAFQNEDYHRLSHSGMNRSLSNSLERHHRECSSEKQHNQQPEGDGLNQDDGTWLWYNPTSNTSNDGDISPNGWDEDSRGSDGLWLTSRPSAGLQQVHQLSPHIATSNHQHHLSSPPPSPCGFGLRRCLQAAVAKYANVLDLLPHPAVDVTVSLAELFLQITMHVIDDQGDHLGDEPLARELAGSAVAAHSLVMQLILLISSVHVAVRSNPRPNADPDGDVAAAELVRLLWSEDGPTTIVTRGVWTRIPYKLPTKSINGDDPLIKLSDAVVDEIDFALHSWREFTATSSNGDCVEGGHSALPIPSVSSVLSHLLRVATTTTVPSATNGALLPLKTVVDVLHHFLLGPHKDRVDALPHAAAEIGIPPHPVGDGDVGGASQWTAFTRHHLQDHFHILTSLVQCVGVVLEPTSRQLSSSETDADHNCSTYHDSEAHQKQKDDVLDITESLHDLLMTHIPPPSWTGRCGTAVQELLSLTTSILQLLHVRRGQQRGTLNGNGCEGEASSSWGEVDEYDIQPDHNNRLSTTSTTTSSTQQRDAVQQQGELSDSMIDLYLHRSRTSSGGYGGGVRDWFQQLKSASGLRNAPPKGLWVVNTLSLVENLSSSAPTSISHGGGNRSIIVVQQMVKSVIHVVTCGASLGVFDSGRSAVAPIGVANPPDSASSSPLSRIIALLHNCLCQAVTSTTPHSSAIHVDEGEADNVTPSQPQMLLSILLSGGDHHHVVDGVDLPSTSNHDTANYFESLCDAIPGCFSPTSIYRDHQLPSFTTKGSDEFAGLWVSFIAVLVQTYQSQRHQHHVVDGTSFVRDNTISTSTGELLDELVFTTLQCFLDGSLPTNSAGHDWTSTSTHHNENGLRPGKTTTMSSASSPLSGDIRILPMYRPLLSFLLLRHLREGHPFNVEVLLSRCVCGHFTETEEDVQVCALPIVMLSLFSSTTTSTTTLSTASSSVMELWGVATKTTIREVRNTLASTLLAAESIPQVLRRLLDAIINRTFSQQHHGSNTRQHGSTLSVGQRHFGSGRRQQHVMPRGSIPTASSQSVLTILLSLLYELSAGSISFVTLQDVTTIFKAAILCPDNSSVGHPMMSSSDWVSIAFVLWRATSGGSTWSLIEAFACHGGGGCGLLPTTILAVPPIGDLRSKTTTTLLSTIGSDYYVDEDESQSSIPSFLASHFASSHSPPQSVDFIVPMVAHLLNAAISVNATHHNGDVDAIQAIVQVLLTLSLTSSSTSSLSGEPSPSGGESVDSGQEATAQQHQQKPSTINLALMCVERVLAHSLLPALSSAIADLVDATCTPNVSHHDREDLIQQSATRIEVILDVWDCFARGVGVGAEGAHNSGGSDSLVAVLLRTGSSFVMDHAEVINNLVSGSCFKTASVVVRLLLAFTALQPERGNLISSTTPTSNAYMPLPLHAVSEPEVCRCVEGLLGALSAMVVTAYGTKSPSNTSTTYYPHYHQDVARCSSGYCLRLFRVLYLGFAHGRDFNNATATFTNITNVPSSSSGMELSHRVQLVRGVLASRLVIPVLISLPDIVHHHQPSLGEESGDWAVLLRDAMYRPHSGGEWQQQLLVHFTQMQVTCGPCVTWPVLRMMLWAGGGVTPSIPTIPNQNKRAPSTNNVSSSPVQATIAAVLREAVCVAGVGAGSAARSAGCKAPRDEQQLNKDDNGGDSRSDTTPLLIQLPPQVLRAVLTA